jgi:hypothetical protein
MKKLALLLVVASLLVASPVMAGPFMNGNDLQKYCSIMDQPSDSHSMIDAQHMGICFGFIEAFNDFHSSLLTLDDFVPLFCIPEKATVSQLIQVVSKYLKENPEKLHLDASYLIIHALREAFPCP